MCFGRRGAVPDAAAIVICMTDAQRPLLLGTLQPIRDVYRIPGSEPLKLSNLSRMVIQ